MLKAQLLDPVDDVLKRPRNHSWSKLTLVMLGMVSNLTLDVWPLAVKIYEADSDSGVPMPLFY